MIDLKDKEATTDQARKKGTSDLFLNERKGSLASRVEEVIKPDSIRAFASKINVSEGTLRRILKGEDPKLSVVEKIADKGNVDFNWLVKGEVKNNSVGCDRTNTNLAEFNEDYVLIPGYHISVSTGHGALNRDAKVERHLAFRRKWLDHKCLDSRQLAVVFARGDSMESTIHNGDSILVDLSDKKLSEGFIYVVRIGEELYAKRLQKYIDGSIELLSDNKEYKDQLVKPSELDQLEIIGKVVWIGKDLI